MPDTFDVKCLACGWATTATSEEVGAEIGRAHSCGRRPLAPAVVVTPRAPRATREQLAALAALRRFVNGAVDLLAAWERLGPFDVLTENLPDPDSFVEFGEQVTTLIIWRDRVAGALGEPEGNGRPEDAVPPRPQAISADEPEDPALDVEKPNGTTPRERLEAEARLRRAREPGSLCDGCGAAGRELEQRSDFPGIPVREGVTRAPFLCRACLGEEVVEAECYVCRGARQQTRRRDRSTGKTYLCCLSCDTAREADP